MRMIGRVRLGFGLVVLGVLLLTAGGARAQDAREVLLRSQEPTDTTYVGEQVTEVIGPPGRPAGRRPPGLQRVFRSGNRLRVNFPNGQVAFDDGVSLLVYFPGQNIVEKGPSALSPKRQRQQVQAIRRGQLQVTALPEESVAGRPCHVLELVPAKGPKRMVWVDKETGLQLRQDLYRPNGAIQRTRFVRINFQAVPPPAMLAFQPPPGVLTVEAGQRRPIAAAEAQRLAQEWGGLLEPGFVPEGYRFRGYFLHRFQNRPGLAMVYDGPGGLLTVFQGPSLGMSGMRQRPGKLRVLGGKVRNADVVVVGAVSEDEMERVVRSMEPQ